jgi:hypothetical protein
MNFNVRLRFDRSAAVLCLVAVPAGCLAGTGSVDPAPGSIFPLGKSTVNVTEADDCGNVRNCSFEVRLFPFVRMYLQEALSENSNEMAITYEIRPNFNYIVETRDDLITGPEWQALPGSPHNSGMVLHTSTVPRCVFRTLIEIPE